MNHPNEKPVLEHCTDKIHVALFNNSISVFEVGFKQPNDAKYDKLRRSWRAAGPALKHMRQMLSAAQVETFSIVKRKPRPGYGS
jgi:hypothetical protein